ncbi:MAG: Xenobiotic-transporting ATPase [Candidatus Taylorbacteria bacterium]|nr:Xenobiotic-transporting ATPase [Candidatus Taylorbacteria bacterium]
MQDKQKITSKAVRQVLSDYWSQYQEYPWQTTLALSAPAIGSVLIFFVPPLIIARLVNVLAAGGEVSLSTMGIYVAAFAGFWVLGELLWRVGMHYLIKIETKGINRLSKTAFARLASRDYDFYSNNFVGTLTKRTLSFSRGFETFTDTIVFNLTTNILPFIFAIIVLWRYSPWLPALLVASLAGVTAVALPIVRRRSKLVALRHEAASKLSGRLSDTITNILAVKSFAQESYEQKIFGQHADDYGSKFKAAADYQNLRFDAAVSPFYVGTNIIGLIAAVYFTHKLGLQAGVMVIVFSYYSQITRMFWEINRVYRNIESSISEAAEFTQMLIEPPAVQDELHADRLVPSDGNIAFEHVDFGYESKEGIKFLEDFNLDIKANQRVGLVGPSGGGKTTLTKLLLRFVDLHSGRITIDGQDIGKVTQESLRESIAYVPQEPLLFHRTLSENIAYSNDEATQEEIVQAAKLARADEFIDRLPQGYQTLVGERGIKLSGGQRQRIAVARAILKKAPILVLDEATSALDSESEKYIQEGLWELMKNKTALVIAHRLSTIKHLDRIIVLSEGKIVQDGTHEELISKPGLYAKLWSHQSGEFLEE